MIARVAPILLAALLACSSTHERAGGAPDRTAPPAGGTAQPTAPAPGGTAMDLLHADSATIDLDLPADGSRTQWVSAPPGHNILFKVTHKSGTVGRMSLTIYDRRNTTIPVSDDAMTCAEPECSFSVEVASAAEPRTLIATCTGSGAMSVRLEATLKAPTPKPSN